MLSANETIAKYGVNNVSSCDLLACIIGNAAKAESIYRDNNDFFKLLSRDVEELQMLGLTTNQAQRLAAARELFYRASEKRQLPHLNGPAAVYQHIHKRLENEEQEHFMVIAMNTKNKVIATKVISKGTLTGTLVHSRDIFTVAFAFKAAGIVVAHNHPSGDPSPSKEDKALTTSLVEAGKIIGIPVLDHLIIGNCNYYSFQEHDEL